MTLTVPTVLEAEEFLTASTLWADQPAAAPPPAAQALLRLDPD
jgi:hypothetical protein